MANQRANEKRSNDPSIEPTAAPIRVFREARRIRRSKKTMQMAMTKATAAEIHGCH